MRPERVLAVAIALLVVGSSLSLVAVPGVLGEEEPPPEPSRLDLQGIDIAAGRVTGGSATLSVTARLRHRGGTTENASLRVQAVDLDSGLVERVRRVPVSTIEGDREVPVTVNVSVEREGGYRIEVVLYRDGERIEAGSRTVRGVGTLQPAYAESPVGFHDFGGGGRASLDPIQYSVSPAPGNRTTLDLSAYLTNRGDRVSTGLTVEFVVRQADSNIVAARQRTSVGRVEPGRTVTPSVSVTVPTGYNYYLNAILLKDGVIVGNARSVANLAPRERISANTTVREIGLQVSDFESGGGPGETRRAVRTVTVTATGGQPGFGIGIAITGIALLLAAGIGRRWRR